MSRDSTKISRSRKPFYRPITELDDKRSARVRTTVGQNLVLGLMALVIIGLFVLSPVRFLHVLIYCSMFYYLADFLFHMLIVVKGMSIKQPNSIARMRNKDSWPTYTILCPMYKEWAVLPQFVEAMGKLDYPKSKLQVMLLLEEDDEETIKAAQDMDLPPYFMIVVVPDSLPKTKPKACNYGLERAQGKYCVIYDAEDIPNPKQLKMAVTAHKRSKQDLGCIQAKLNFYNHDHNFLTKLFTLDYSYWYEVILPGLMAINAPIPLGGTSNHFPTELLREIGGWDAHNVTEDADLGMRLSQLGYRTLVIDSTTMEEPNGNVKSWVKQRSRWIKGYMITHLVHSRNSSAFLRNGRPFDLPLMHILLGVRSFGLLLTAGLWLIFVGNIIARLLGYEIIELQSWASYLIAFNLVFLNAMYIYTYSLAIAKRKQWSLIGSLILLPFYWGLMMVAAVKALYELIVMPYYWQKTQHGIHLQNVTNEA